MNFQRFILLLILSIGFHTAAQAQDYSIDQKSQRINDTKYEGYSININGAFEKVTEQVYDYLKDRSKIRRKRNHYSIAEFKMDNIELDSTVIYLKLNERDNLTQVWLGIKTFGIDEDRVEEIEKSLQVELVLIARSYYVHQQELKIIEAETAAQIISKKQQTLINENSELTIDLKEAEARKIELNNTLEENRLAIEVLKQKLIDNKFDQDSTYLDLQKVNRVIEGQKQKLKEID